MNADADSGKPFREPAAQGGASGDEGFDAASKAYADFREDQLVGQLPARRGWSMTGENCRLVGATDGKWPAIDMTLGAAAGRPLGLGIDFLVDPGYRHADRGAHFQQRRWEVLHEGAVCESDAVVEHRE